MKKVSLFLTSFIASLIFFFGCERDVFTPPTNTENPDDCERVVNPVYFINNLEKPIKIEIHRDSMSIINPSINKEEVFWKIDRDVLKFKIQPNDTICFDSVVYSWCKGMTYFIPPKSVAFGTLKGTYYSIKITYNKKQYKYTDRESIDILLSTGSLDYIRFTENKREHFGWE